MLQVKPTNPKDAREVARLKQEQGNYISEYLRIKKAYDQILLQLIADLKDKNGLKVYRLLNKEFKIKEMSASAQTTGIHDRTKNYHLAFSQAYKLYDSYIPTQIAASPRKGMKAMAFIGWDPITALLTLGVETTTGARDARATKVEAICNQLNDLRLSPVSAINTAVEEEEEKEAKAGG